MGEKGEKREIWERERERRENWKGKRKERCWEKQKDKMDGEDMQGDEEM